jgi:hypothetical protein
MSASLSQSRLWPFCSRSGTRKQDQARKGTYFRRFESCSFCGFPERGRTCLRGGAIETASLSPHMPTVCSIVGSPARRSGSRTRAAATPATVPLPVVAPDGRRHRPQASARRTPDILPHNLRHVFVPVHCCPDPECPDPLAKTSPRRSTGEGAG